MRQISLDDPETRKRLDGQSMLDLLRAVPEQCQLGWENGIGLGISPDHGEVDAVVVAGMGGSAMGADLVRGLTQDRLPVPMVVIRDYRLPAFVDGRTLVFLSSYSGSTEETLAAFRDASERGAKLVALGGGGRLLEEAPGPIGRIHADGMPRAVMVESMMLLMGILTNCGLLSDIDTMAARLPDFAREQVGRFDADVPEAENPAKRLARSLRGRVPVVMGAGALAPVARRWKAQFNENGDQWAVIDELPEFNHNTIQGIRLPSAAADLLHVVQLASEDDVLRTRRQADIGGRLVAETGIPVTVVSAEGDSSLARLMSLVIYGDFVSYYVAMLNEVDPTGIPLIAELKARLAAEG